MDHSTHQDAVTAPPPSRTRSERIARFAVRHGSRPKTMIALSALSVGDFFLPALPTQTSVIALGLLQPQRALWIALAFAAAAATGTGLVALFLSFVESYAQAAAQESLGDRWAAIAQNIRDYGVWAVLLASIFPTPPRTIVIAALLAGALAPLVMLAVFCGKLLWFGGVLAMLRYAPARLRKLPFIGRQLQTLERLRNEEAVLASQAGQR
jgi:membrane protein YqaA with SNARE-associated domain